MTITRKNYQAMANVLLTARELAYSEAATKYVNADDTSDKIGILVTTTIDVVIDNIATMLKQDNPNFDTARFLAATKQKQQ